MERKLKKFTSFEEMKNDSKPNSGGESKVKRISEEMKSLFNLLRQNIKK